MKRYNHKRYHWINKNDCFTDTLEKRLRSCYGGITLGGSVDAQSTKYYCVDDKALTSRIVREILL